MVSHYEAKKSAVPEEWKPLNAQQELFVREYLIDLNVDDACKRSGYHKNNGYKLLKHPHVMETVRIEMRKRAIKSELKAETVLTELYGIATSDVTDAFESTKDGGLVLKELKEMPIEIRRAIKSIQHQPIVSGEGLFTGYYKTKVDFYDKVRALELLGRHLGMFAEKEPVNTESVNPLIAALSQSMKDAWK